MEINYLLHKIIELHMKLTIYRIYFDFEV